MATAIVASVEQAVGDQQVLTVRLRVGALAALVPAAMHFAWDLACADTPLAGARLEIDDVPVSVHCGDCDTTSTLPDPLPLHCPTCHSRGVQLRTGQELEIGTVELADEPAPMVAGKGLENPSAAGAYRAATAGQDTGPHTANRAELHDHAQEAGVGHGHGLRRAELHDHAQEAGVAR